MLDMKTFKHFLLEEMKKQQMSARAFAHWVGITHTTMNRLLDPKDDKPPSLASLVLIARKTKTPMGVLFKLIYPDAEDDLLRFDPDVIALAQQILELPIEQRDLAESLILGMTLKNQQKIE